MLKDILILHELQKIDLEIDELEKTKNNFPIKVKELKDALAVEKKESEAKKQVLLDLEKKKKTLELDLKEKEEKMGKSEERMMGVKSNEEYQAMKKEIEMAKQEVSFLEEQILEIMLQMDQYKEKHKEVEKKIIQKTEDVTQTIKKMEEDISRIDIDLSQKKQTRETIVSDIKPDLLSVYQRIRSREALAVAEIKQEKCLGCHMSIPPQLYNQIQKGENMYSCLNCHRLLVFVVPKKEES